MYSKFAWNGGVKVFVWFRCGVKLLGFKLLSHIFNVSVSSYYVYGLSGNAENALGYECHLKSGCM